MKTAELLELQTSLIRCLTDPAALREFRSGAAEFENLSFIDPELVHLMSAFYQSKRLDKLTKVLPLTLAYLEPEMGELTAEFMTRHPPLNADTYTHGCQFYGFLKRRWRTRDPNPPFLPDLAYCELARVGIERQKEPGNSAVLTHLTSPMTIVIRRRRGVRLYQTQYDIQSLFAPTGDETADILPDSACLVLSRPVGSVSGKILRIAPELFGMLKGLSGWTRFNLAADARGEQTFALLQQLEGLGILEVQLCESG